MPAFEYKILPEYIDGFGRLSLSGLTRLLQRAATDHTDELGYTSRWYQDHDSAWVARGHRIELKNPVGPSETVRIETDVEDFKRIRSLRTYTVYSKQSDDRIGSGLTEWVYLDRTTNRPKRIPESMMEDFDPIYDEESPNRVDFVSPEIPDNNLTQSYRIQFRDLDELAHVNNVVYTEYLLDAILRSYGPSDELTLKTVPDSFVLSKLTIRYLGQANWGNQISCHLNRTNGDATNTEFDFTIKRDTERIVEGSGIWKE